MDNLKCEAAYLILRKDLVGVAPTREPGDDVLLGILLLFVFFSFFDLVPDRVSEWPRSALARFLFTAR